MHTTQWPIHTKARCLHRLRLATNITHNNQASHCPKAMCLLHLHLARLQISKAIMEIPRTHIPRDPGVTLNTNHPLVKVATARQIRRMTLGLA